MSSASENLIGSASKKLHPGRCVSRQTSIEEKQAEKICGRSATVLVSPKGIPIIMKDGNEHSRAYTKIKDIGTGSFSKAILVQEKSSGNYYVMKIVQTYSLGAKERRDTLNEVRVLSSLKHPYIINYKESFIDANGHLCILMDYADGGDLHKTISMRRKETGRGFSEKQILRWFTQAAFALKHLHDKHILHRDLKSQNVFLMHNGRLRLGDFGIAKVLDTTVSFTKTQIGTPYYLSPEICRNKPYSWASDIWSLGCILYELATLQVPFDAPNISVLLEKITRHQPPPFPDHYSVGLRRLYNECMQRDWQKRPSATDILLKDLIQDEIKQMLLEEQHRRRAAEPAIVRPPSSPDEVESVDIKSSRECDDVPRPITKGGESNHCNMFLKPPSADLLHNNSSFFEEKNPASFDKKQFSTDSSRKGPGKRSLRLASPLSGLHSQSTRSELSSGSFRSQECIKMLDAENHFVPGNTEGCERRAVSPGVVQPAIDWLKRFHKKKR